MTKSVKEEVALQHILSNPETKRIYETLLEENKKLKKRIQELLPPEEDEIDDWY